MLDSIESAVKDIKLGKMVIVVDDEERENEGDFITAARNVTPEVINFMSKHGRGLICAPLLEDRWKVKTLFLLVVHHLAQDQTFRSVLVVLI
jgi:3,4-dihydroxy 2-butanone 4-phosphate synthase/GTP cyclohydrolase II